MKILLLVPRHQGSQSKQIDPQTSLPLYQAQNFWYKALRSLGHDVKVIVYTGTNSAIDYYSSYGDYILKRLKLPRTLFQKTLQLLFDSTHKKQKEIKETSQNFQPHLVIISGNTDLVFPETLAEIKKVTRCKLVLLNGLSPSVFATKAEREFVYDLDYVFTNDRYHALDWLMLGARRAKSLPVSAIDPSFHKKYRLSPKEKGRYSSDVCFVGSLYPDLLYKDRRNLLESLTSFNLKIWSPNEKEILENPKLKKFYQGHAEGIKMLKIFSASKICLNFHGDTMLSGGNMRTFEICGARGFQILDRTDPSWFEADKELVTFHSKPDLYKKVSYYLSHERERREIALAGYKRTQKDHTYQKRFEKLIKLVFK